MMIPLTAKQGGFELFQTQRFQCGISIMIIDKSYDICIEIKMNFLIAHFHPLYYIVLSVSMINSGLLSLDKSLSEVFGRIKLHKKRF